MQYQSQESVLKRNFSNNQGPAALDTMSISSRSTVNDSPTMHQIRISSLLNESTQSSKKPLMPQSGLPTPDSTPIQELIQDSSAGSSFHHSSNGEAVDPAVLPSHSTEDDTRQSSLFPESVFTPPKETVLPQRSARSRLSINSLPSNQSPSPRTGAKQHADAKLMDVAFEENVPAEVWYQYHVSDKVGVARPETIVFKSQLWTAASLAPKEYADQLQRTSHDFTFASGNAPGLNWLSTVCGKQSHLSQGPSKGRSRSVTKAELTHQWAKNDARQAGKRRPSLKKRTNVEGGEPEAKRMRAAAVHKEKPNSYTEVPDYSPSLSTFDAANVKALVPKGGRIDLSNDPLVGLIGQELNTQEKNFAEINQLDVNKYLINKRKIFQGRIQVHLQGKKSFTKTHAQQAAIIDVNKASRMWEFFDQAGWLDMKHFKKHIPAEMKNMRAKNMAIAKEYLD